MFELASGKISHKFYISIIQSCILYKCKRMLCDSEHWTPKNWNFECIVEILAKCNKSLFLCSIIIWV